MQGRTEKEWQGQNETPRLRVATWPLAPLFGQVAPEEHEAQKPTPPPRRPVPREEDGGE